MELFFLGELEEADAAEVDSALGEAR